MTGKELFVSSTSIMFGSLLVAKKYNIMPTYTLASNRSLLAGSIWLGLVVSMPYIILDSFEHVVKKR